MKSVSNQISKHVILRMITVVFLSYEEVYIQFVHRYEVHWEILQNYYGDSPIHPIWEYYLPVLCIVFKRRQQNRFLFLLLRLKVVLGRRLFSGL